MTCGIPGIVQHSDSDVLHFAVECKSKQQDLHDRHAEEDEQRTLIPEYVIKLFLNEGEQLFHLNHFFVWLLWPVDKRPLPSNWH